MNLQKWDALTGMSGSEALGIWVLQATAMPSILVETGYITNPEEEDYLNSDTGQNEIAECITRAVKTYISWIEKQQVDNGAENTNNNKSQQKLQNTEAFLRMVEQKEKSAKTPK